MEKGREWLGGERMRREKGSTGDQLRSSDGTGQDMADGRVEMEGQCLERWT